MYDDIERSPLLSDALRDYRNHRYRSALERSLTVVDMFKDFIHSDFDVLSEHSDDAEANERTAAKRAALLLAARCCVQLGDTESGMMHHGHALTLAEDTYDVISMADDAIDAGLPCDYCVACYERAAREFLEAHRPVDAAGAYNKAGICRFKTGTMLSNESELFENAFSLLENEQLSDTQQVLYALVCGNLAECRVRQDRFDDAVGLYERACSIFSEHLDDDVCLQHYAMCQRSVSEICRMRGDNVEAGVRLNKAIDALEQRHLPSPAIKHLLSSCYNAFGTICFQMGDYEGEVSACSAALHLRPDESHDPVGTATIYTNRAQAYEQLGKPRRAEDDYRTAIRLLEGDHSDEARLYTALRHFSLGGILDNADRVTEAVDCYMVCADTLREFRLAGKTFGDIDSEQMIDMEALCRYKLGLCFTRVENRDYYRAMNEHRTAVELLQASNISAERAAHIAALFTSLGEMFELFDDYDAAKENFENAEHYHSVAAISGMIISAARASDIDAPLCDDGVRPILHDRPDEDAFLDDDDVECDDGGCFDDFDYDDEADDSLFDDSDPFDDTPEG